jgi:hypothetical protein
VGVVAGEPEGIRASEQADGSLTDARSGASGAHGAADRPVVLFLNALLHACWPTPDGDQVTVVTADVSNGGVWPKEAPQATRARSRSKTAASARPRALGARLMDATREGRSSQFRLVVVSRRHHCDLPELFLGSPREDWFRYFHFRVLARDGSDVDTSTFASETLSTSVFVPVTSDSRLRNPFGARVCIASVSRHRPVRALDLSKRDDDLRPG